MAMALSLYLVDTEREFTTRIYLLMGDLNYISFP